MSWRRPWVVLVPGDLSWVESRAREILEECEDGSERQFMVIPGQGRYQAIVEKGLEGTDLEYLLGEVFSRDCEEPVYCIENHEEGLHISRYVKGERFYEGTDAEKIIRAVGCVPPWSEEPPQSLQLPKRLRRTVLLIQGLDKGRVLRAFERYLGLSLPDGHYRFEDGPQGLLVTDGICEVGPSSVVSQRYPRATVYSVSATPDLEHFSVWVERKRKVKLFRLPPSEFPLFPVLDEVMGEREPERILAALGIPKEWFII